MLNDIKHDGESSEVPEGIGNFVKLFHSKGKYSLLANWSRSTTWSPGKGFRIEFGDQSYPIAGVELMRSKGDILPAMWVAFKTDDAVALKEGDVVRIVR